MFQNLRGTQRSGGINNLFNAERADGVDTVNWIRAQTWSDGTIGAMGDSAAGFSTHLLAAEQPEGLKATFSQASCGNLWGSSILPDHGGVKLEAFMPFMLGQSLELGDDHLASLQLSDEELAEAGSQVSQTLGQLFSDDPNEQFDALTVQPFDQYAGVSTLLPAWSRVLDENQRSALNNYYNTQGASTVPGMHVTLWQDIFVECSLQDFQALTGRGTEQRLLVLDGSHYDIDDPQTWPYLPLLDWFDRHLKNAQNDGLANVQYAVQSLASTTMPSKVLQNADTWPPISSVTESWYPSDNGRLISTASDSPTVIEIQADPNTPITTLGGRHLILDAGIFAQPPIENTNSVKTFKTAVFQDDRTIAGELKLNARLSSDLPNVDVHARLVEVTPTGQRYLIVDGMQRGRYTTNAIAPIDLMIDSTTAINVVLGNIAHRVTAGNYLQLEISPSNFPAWDINPQVSGSAFTAVGSQAGSYQLTDALLTIPFLN